VCVPIFATVVATGIAVAPLPVLAQAPQKFPTKPVRLVVGYVPGAQSDTIARIIATKMSERWGQAVVVENRPAAGGTLAAVTVAKATPDGHTLLYGGANFAISAAMQANLPYDPFKDFVGVSQIGYGTQVLVVGHALGIKSVKDLIALAKAQPGKLIFGSAATGSGTHLAGARFNLAAGIKVVHVAFKGGAEAMIEAMTGRVHYSMGTLVAALPFIKDGKLLALAVHTPQRSHVLPDVPALAETLPEFKRPDATNGVLAPAATPRPVVNQVSKEIARILDLPDMKEWLQSAGIVPAPTTPEEHDRILRAQIETLSKVVRDIGLRPK
jgi:tripartite-type tricarboxylate transporter receptor subunit TctC